MKNDMPILTNELLQDLISNDQSPCLSLFMPTHRSRPENIQDPLRFRSLLEQFKEILAKQYSVKEIEKLLEPFESLAENVNFWNHTFNSIAIFGNAKLFKVVNLPTTVKELLIVADSFHTKPLRQYLQSMDRYYLLGLSLDRFQLFEGNRFSLTEIELPVQIPKTLADALGKDLTEQHSTVASYGGVGVGSVSMHHGDGGRKDEIDKDTEKFFRIVSKNIYETYSKPSGLPLLLAALPEHHHLYKQVSKNPLLLANGINSSPEFISADNLIKLAWDVMEPAYLSKIKSLSEKFEQAKAYGTGSDNIKEIAKAVAEGRVDTLLIEENRIIAGKITNMESGTIKTGELTNFETDDLLDDIAELATKKGTSVWILPMDKMPVITGIAAVFRY